MVTCGALKLDYSVWFTYLFILFIYLIKKQWLKVPTVRANQCDQREVEGAEQAPARLNARDQHRGREHVGEEQEEHKSLKRNYIEEEEEAVKNIY
jgi:hypothetical protein